MHHHGVDVCMILCVIHGHDLIPVFLQLFRCWDFLEVNAGAGHNLRAAVVSCEGIDINTSVRALFRNQIENSRCDILKLELVKELLRHYIFGHPCSSAGYNDVTVDIILGAFDVQDVSQSAHTGFGRSVVCLTEISEKT